MGDEEPLNLYSESDRISRVIELLADEAIAPEQAALDLLVIENMEDVSSRGGYPDDIADWDAFPDDVVIASTDPGKDNAAPMLVIHSKQWLRRAARIALDAGRFACDEGDKDVNLFDEVIDAFRDALGESEATDEAE